MVGDGRERRCAARRRSDSAVLVSAAPDIDGALSEGVPGVKAFVTESAHGVATGQVTLAIGTAPVVLNDLAITGLGSFLKHPSLHIEKGTLLLGAAISVGTREVLCQLFAGDSSMARYMDNFDWANDGKAKDFTMASV
ncbi:hypothetical protein ACJZ2D_012887 [Fusarium nematophilum]